MAKCSWQPIWKKKKLYVSDRKYKYIVGISI